MSGVVTFGETMALLSPHDVGPLRHATSLGLGVAGAESNLAVGVTRLGTPARWVGRVGDDELGRLVETTLRGQGVHVTAVVDDTAPTGLMLKEQRTATTTRVSYYRSCSAGSRLRPEDLDEQVLRKADVVHATGITAALSGSAKAATTAALQVARAAGVTTSFDLNHRSALWSDEDAGRVLRTLVPLVDVLFATDAEARLLVDAGDDADAGALARALADLGPRTVLLKRGALGAVACVDSEVVDVPPHPVRVLDPVGAGDAFAAGYLAALCAGQPLTERLDLAARAGAFAVMVRGDWEGAPTRAELTLLSSDDVVR